jgi:hypothetical protein
VAITRDDPNQTYSNVGSAAEMASLIADKQEDGNVVCCRVAGKGDFSGAAGAVYIEPGDGQLCKDSSCCWNWHYFCKLG